MMIPFSFKAKSITTATFWKFTICLCWMVWAVAYSLTASINAPTFHLDGAFQTASGLYRLDSGQFPGKDFYPYLGIGPLYLLYPIFVMFGANLASSVFAAQLMVLLAGTISVSLIWHFVWRPMTFSNSLVAGCLIFLAPIALSTNITSLHLPPWFAWASNPGNSLRPLRSAVPYFAAIGLYLAIFRITNARIKYMAAGLLTGATLLWSNDFAIPTTALLGIPILLHALRKQEVCASNVFYYIGASILCWVILLGFTTAGHPLPLLRYYFVDVAHDQWWYFGRYSEASRIFYVAEIGKLLSIENYIPSFVWVALALAAYRSRLPEHAMLLWIGLALFAGGAAATVGGHIVGEHFGGYFAGFYFWGTITAIIGGLHLVWALGGAHVGRGTALLGFCLGISVLAMTNAVYQHKQQTLLATSDSKRFFVPELGGFLPIEWREYVGMARSSGAKITFEEYWGLWSAILRIFPKWPVDSVIHALGETRSVATSSLSQAEVIITTREETLPSWVGWNISQNYWFYQNILSGWIPQYESPLTTVWRNGKTRDSVGVACHILDKDKFLIVTSATGLLEINIEFDFSSGGSRSLVLVKNNLSQSPVSQGYISVDPKAGGVLFPALALNKGKNHFDVQVLPANKHGIFSLKSCAATEFVGVPIYGKSFFNDPFYLSDVNWEHGIARQWAGFLVPNELKFLSEYVPGRSVGFANGENREIVRVETYGQYLIVFVTGYPLDIANVGIPREFIVLDKKLANATRRDGS